MASSAPLRTCWPPMKFGQDAVGAGGGGSCWEQYRPLHRIPGWSDGISRVAVLITDSLVKRTILSRSTHERPKQAVQLDDISKADRRTPAGRRPPPVRRDRSRGRSQRRRPRQRVQRMTEAGVIQIVARHRPDAARLQPHVDDRHPRHGRPAHVAETLDGSPSSPTSWSRSAPSTSSSRPCARATTTSSPFSTRASAASRACSRPRRSSIYDCRSSSTTGNSAPLNTGFRGLVFISRHTQT